MFEIGDYIVKANTGLCVIDGITIMSSTSSDTDKKYYVLLPLDNAKAKLFVPIDSDSTSIRPAMEHDEAAGFIRHIPEIEPCVIINEKTREQEYKEAIKSNNPERLIAIIKNITIRNIEREGMGKKVTAVDDRYLKMAEGILFTELAHAIGKTKEAMHEIMYENFLKF